MAVSPLCRRRGGQQEVTVSSRCARGHPLPQQVAEEPEPDTQAFSGEGHPTQALVTPQNYTPPPHPPPHSSHPLCMCRTVPRRMLSPRGAAGMLRWVCPGGVQLTWGREGRGAHPPLGFLIAGHRAGWGHSGWGPQDATNHNDGSWAGGSSCHPGVRGSSSGREGVWGALAAGGAEPRAGTGAAQENTHRLPAPPCLFPDPTGFPEPRLATPSLVPANPSTQTHPCKRDPPPTPKPLAKAPGQGGCQPLGGQSPACPLPPQPTARGESSDACYFCGRRVYILERASAEGRFFHRGCFQCRRCGATLRLGDYAFDEEDGEAGLGRERGCS